MSLSITCENCGASRRVNERLAGRKIRCPECEAPITIPHPSAEDSAETVIERPAPNPRELAAHAAAAPASAKASSKDNVSAVAEAIRNADVSALTAQPIVAPATPQDVRASHDVSLASLADDDEDDALPPRKKRDDEELDMTPMVDVTFLLLIFFMVTASFSLQKSIAMPRQTSDLPSSQQQDDPPDQLDPIELEIDQRGGFLVLAPDGETETPGKQNLINALKLAIGANPNEMQLNIKVHEEAQLQSLVDGMDAGKIAGFNAIQVTQVDGFLN